MRRENISPVFLVHYIMHCFQKHFRVKIQIFFFKSEKDIGNLFFLFIKCSVLYISGWQTDFYIPHIHQIDEHFSLSWQIGF